jgi:Extracellular link domain
MNFKHDDRMNYISSYTVPAVASANRSISNRIGNVYGTVANKAANVKARVFDTMGGVQIVLGLILIVFVALVIYNETIGAKVSEGWDKLLRLLKLRTDISVTVPGNVEVPVTPEYPEEKAVPLPPLTASGLPTPVTVPTAHDEPPKDAIGIPPEDRPSGMPRSAVATLGGADGDTNADGTFALGGRKEVFNISRNIYTFNDAAAVCAAAGAELATYDQVKEAYEAGADWCNYGWIKGQMAVYPTQKDTYEKLQKSAPEFRNVCGKPGINGGYFDNPDLLFGVNCYGAKPAKKGSDDILDSQVALPQSAEEIEFEKRVQKFRDDMATATVLPFSKGRWQE